jgi:hypothetical protein
MGEITRRENEWQDKATMRAIGEARKIAQGSSLQLANTPVGRLSEQQWGWLLSAAIFGWISTRCEQAIAEGMDQEDAVRMIEMSPAPGDVAVIRSILPTLASQVKIDWARPLSDWSKDEMTDFLLQAWLLANNADHVLADGAGSKILHKKPADDLQCPHGMPRFLCRKCAGDTDGEDDRPDDGIPF